MSKESAVILERRFVPEGTLILRQGEPGNSAYLIQSGSVSVYTEHDGKTIELAKLELGQIFGEMALIDREPRSASVTSVDDTRLLVMKRPDFFHIIKHERDMAVKLLWQFLGVLTGRLRATSRELGEAKGQLALEELLALDDSDLEEAL